MAKQNKQEQSKTEEQKKKQKGKIFGDPSIECE